MAYTFKKVLEGVEVCVCVCVLLTYLTGTVRQQVHLQGHACACWIKQCASCQRRSPVTMLFSSTCITARSLAFGHAGCVLGVTMPVVQSDWRVYVR